jgi:predicted component of viral defense system (DUF524 family)
MAIQPRRDRISDFDTSQLLATHEQHEKNISDLTERLVKIESQIATPQAAAAFLEECAKDSRNFEGVFATMFTRFVTENPQVKDAVQKQIAESDRNFVVRTFKRFGLGMYSLCLIILGAVVKPLTEWLFSLLPHAK